ncbi:hypothetical protein L6452_08506 [Arctium lappa]|uniref:Uncharacterized protein n=1 Tax=Arctium lappa TaxID=4217 RepID=A0ACB9DHS9_ARCLA|nr:hypothetical protein L6452_08506 [Arctium lappa]
MNPESVLREEDNSLLELQIEVEDISCTWGCEEGEYESSIPSEWTKGEKNSEEEWMVEESIFDNANGNQGGLRGEQEVIGERRMEEKEMEAEEGKPENVKS